MSLPKFRFDADQEHQLKAVDAVCEVFKGLPDVEDRLTMTGQDEIVSNLPAGFMLDPALLNENLQTLQQRQGMPHAPLIVASSWTLETAGNELHSYPEFTVEMETGTGKTYVYLRTMFELRRRYGFRKFVVVVPSVAIFEGVIKSVEITRNHFGQIYRNESLRLTKYDGTAVSKIRHFATNTSIEVLVITLDSFNSDKNVIYRASEKLQGERKPFQFIQATRPILILDEPQNMETARAQQALASLKPLAALRYSATHKTSPNRVYQLTPFDAFRGNLVKRIEVHGVIEGQDYDKPLLRLVSISTTGTLVAVLEALIERHGRPQLSTVRLKKDDHLGDKTPGGAFSAGWEVTNIHRGEGFVDFANGKRLYLGDQIGEARASLFRVQIRETIRRHLLRQAELLERGIKVLSLFFVDRVASYESSTGIIRRIFDEEWSQLRSHFPWAASLAPDQVRRAYFAFKKGSEVPIDITFEEAEQSKDQRAAAKEAFALIMRNKEQLLSFDEPVCCIFAHSALREGWDNPNVFQICTLNETRSELKKRQEIGRGLRLCVNQAGERVKDDRVNVLTVVPNQSYQDYCQSLQTEYALDELAAVAPPAPSDARRQPAVRNQRIFQSVHFRDFWSRLAKRAEPIITIDEELLVAECIAAVSNERIPEPRLFVQVGDYVQYQYAISLRSIANGAADLRVVREGSNNEDRTWEFRVMNGDSLKDKTGEDSLNGMIVREVSRAAVRLGDSAILRRDQPIFHSVAATVIRRQRQETIDRSEQVLPNILERTARETGVTRATVLRVYRGLPRETTRHYSSNPEGFADVFLTRIREAVANHVAERLRFELGHSFEEDLESLFPLELHLVQQNTVEGGDSCLYNHVQKDSTVEETFVDVLRADNNVLLFFKFPPKYKVRLPRLLGNYNPDWGVVRRVESGEAVLHLVRETKGTVDVERLRFPHERRKVVAAYRYFSAVNADYRIVSENTAAWWQKEPIEQQLRMPLSRAVQED